MELIDAAPPPDLAEDAGLEAASVDDAPAHQPRFPLWRELVAGGLYVALLIAMGRAVATPLSNTDTYFHLRFGAEFLRRLVAVAPGLGQLVRHRVLAADPVAARGRDGLPRADLRAGRRGLAVRGPARGVVQHALLRRPPVGRPAALAAAHLPALLAASKGLSMRPQMISFLLVAVTAAAWLRTREDGRLRWWLVPMTWLWAMSHGMWSLGIGSVWSRSSGSLSTATARAAPRCGPPSSRALGRGRRAHARSAPRSTAQVLAVGVALAVLLRVEPARLDLPLVHRARVLLAVTIILMVRRGDGDLVRPGAAPADRGLRPLVVADRAGRGDDARPVRRAQARAGPHPPAIAAAPGAPPRRRRARSPSVALAAAVPHAADAPPPQPTWVDPALTSLPAGHQGRQRLGLGRLPDVALPAARPAHARVRRHVHDPRAAANHRHLRPPARVGRRAARHRRHRRGAASDRPGLRAPAPDALDRRPQLAVHRDAAGACRLDSPDG